MFSEQNHQININNNTKLLFQNVGLWGLPTHQIKYRTKGIQIHYTSCAFILSNFGSLISRIYRQACRWTGCTRIYIELLRFTHFSLIWWWRLHHRAFLMQYPVWCLTGQNCWKKKNSIEYKQKHAYQFFRSICRRKNRIFYQRLIYRHGKRVHAISFVHCVLPFFFLNFDQPNLGRSLWCSSRVAAF